MPQRHPTGPGTSRSRASSPRLNLRNTPRSPSLRDTPRSPSLRDLPLPPSHGHGRHSQRSYSGRSEGDPSSRRYGPSLHNLPHPRLLPPAEGFGSLDVISELQPWLGATSAPRTIIRGSRGTSLAETHRSRGSRGDAYPGIQVRSPTDRYYSHPGPRSQSPLPCSITIRVEDDSWSSESEGSSWDSVDDGWYSGDEGRDGLSWNVLRRGVSGLEPEYSCGRCPRCRGCRRR